jgi:CHAT domain-containing protein/tetratricopeptide (TPR) repeat protein
VWSLSQPGRPLLLLIVALGCVIQAASRQAHDARIAGAFADLVQAAGAIRILEGRLTGGFAYGAWKPDSDHRVTSAAIMGAALRVRTRYPQNSREAHIAGVFLGDQERTTSALGRLAATHAHPAAMLTSDLSALHLARAHGDGTALEAARALDYAQQALSTDPTLAEALFNRALALERLGSHEAAARAWKAYLTVDPAGGWADEARRASAAAANLPRRRPTSQVRDRLATSTDAEQWQHVEAIVQDVPQAAREYLDDLLLPAWAADIQAGAEDRAALRLARARRLAELLRRRHDERAWDELVERLARADGKARDDLASALLDLRDVRALIEQSRIESAWAPLSRASTHVAAAPSLQAAVDFWRAYIEWYRGHLQLVERLTGELARRCAADGFLYLQGRALMLQASTLGSFTRHTASQAISDRALQVLDHIGEREYAASRRVSQGFELALQGDLRAAWNEQSAALTMLRDIDSPRRRFVVLNHGVILATRFGLPYAALAIQQALIDEEKPFDDAGGLIRQLLERARLHVDLANQAAARRDLDAATNLLPRIADASNRAQYEDDLQIQRARLLEHDAPIVAAELLGGAIERLSKVGHIFQLTELHLTRGRAWARAGRQDAALDEWLKGIQRFEDQRLELRDEQLRISHFSRAWEIYTEAVALLVARGETERALALVERSHARALLDSVLPTQQVSSATVRDAVAALPDGVLVLVYESLPSELLIWQIERTRISMERIPVAGDALRRLASGLREEPAEAMTPALLTQLGQILLGRLEQPLTRARSLVIVLDPAIASVPFAALPMPGTTTPLVTRVPITFAPSLTLLDIATRRLATARPSTPRAAFFADPRRPAERVILPALPQARREIDESASVYRDAQAFVGNDATESRLLQVLETVDVLHFAGHAISNAEYPSRSRILTAADGDGDGDVLPQEIAGRLQTRTRLVVLSACSTAAGAPAFGEGVLSLARPFLSAGVPQVVGTLWDIEDRAGRALMPRFHHWYSQGVGAAEALRRAQVELLESRDPVERDPRTWAAFVLVGGLE